MTMIQIQKFTQGGFVAHKMTVQGSPCLFSAWFTPEGVLVDAERIDRAGRGYPAGILQRRALQRSFAVYHGFYA
jgi:hypothetical protein